MAGVLCDSGLAPLLTGIGNNTSGAYKVGLWQNNFGPPTVDSGFSDFVPADFPGYVPSDLGIFAPVDGPIAHVASLIYAASTFVRTAGVDSQTVYGYYVYDELASFVLWAQLFTVPILIDTEGQTVVVVPLLTLRDQSV
jgi:hypothetical protein